KADSLASRGLCAVDLFGVWNFKGRNSVGGVALLADLDVIAWNDREVFLIFDSDIMTKRSVEQAMLRLKEILERRGARVRPRYLPCGRDGRKVGVDDFFVQGHTLEELVALPHHAPFTSVGALGALGTLGVPAPKNQERQGRQERQLGALAAS